MGCLHCLVSTVGNAVVKEVQREIECVHLEKAFHKMRTEPMPTYRKMLKSNDAKEGVAAFVEKREPKF